MRALLCLPVTGSAGEEKNTMHLKQLLAGVTALALGEGHMLEVRVGV